MVAKSEEEAWEKLNKYNDEMVKSGFARFTPFNYPTVELFGVIA